MTIFVLAALVSTAIPAERVDNSWGVLSRSTHLRGRWEIVVDDGARLEGDWIVINRENYVTRDMGGGGGPAKAIHLVDSASGTHCSFDADRPSYLYCVGGKIGHVHLEPGATLAFDGATPLQAYRCAGAVDCKFRHVGNVTIRAKRVAASLADEEMLFEHTTGGSFAKSLGATATRTGDVLSLEMPFHVVTKQAVTRTEANDVYYPQQIVDATATIRIGPQPADVAIIARETGRYIEDCKAYRHANISCMPNRPLCTRRATAR